MNFSRFLNFILKVIVNIYGQWPVEYIGQKPSAKFHPTIGGRNNEKFTSSPPLRHFSKINIPSPPDSRRKLPPLKTNPRSSEQTPAAAPAKIRHRTTADTHPHTQSSPIAGAICRVGGHAGGWPALRLNARGGQTLRA